MISTLSLISAALGDVQARDDLQGFVFFRSADTPFEAFAIQNPRAQVH